MTLAELLTEAEESQRRGTRTPQQEQLLAAFWAGQELGRGTLAREVERRRLAAIAVAEKKRYWREAMAVIPGNPASTNDDSPEILGWDWPACTVISS